MRSGRRRRGAGAVVAWTLLLPLLVPGGAAAAESFTDLDRTIHDAEIERLVAAGLTAGCAPDAYCPTANVSRGQLATFLAAALALPPAPPRFSDVPADGTHAGAIGALAAEGIVAGCAPERFCPNAPITRAQLATLLAAAYELPAGSVDGFSDVRPGDVHAPGIGAVAAADISRGCDTDRFCPATTLPRDQMAALLSRTLRLDDDGCRPLAPGGTVSADLGAVAPGFPVSTATRIGDVLYVASLSLSPSRIVGYDVRTGQVVKQFDLPTGLRTWALAADGPLLYIGQWGVTGDRTNWYRFDTRYDFLAEIGSIPTGGEFWDLAVADDRSVWAATAVPNTLYRYPLGGRTIETLRFAGPAEEVTQVAFEGGELFVGTGRGQAHLLAVDPATMASRELQAPAMEDAFGVYDLAVTDELIVVGLGRDPGALVVLDRVSGEVLVSREFPEENAIGGITVTGATIHFAGVRTGTLYRLTVPDDAVQRLAQPIPWSPVRASFVVGDELVGLSGSPLVWRVPLDGGAVEHDDLVMSGARAGLEAPQSLVATHDELFTGMNNAIQVRRADDPDAIRRIAVPGEVKAMRVVDGTVLLAMYPTAEMWRYQPAFGTVAPLADWEDVQDRPTQIAHDPTTGAVFVGTQSDFAGGGGLVSVDRRRWSTELWTDPLGPAVAVHSVEALDGAVYLGGDGEDAPVAAVDPETRQQRWSAVPVPGTGPVTDLVVLEDRLHGLTRDGWWFILDTVDGDVLWSQRVLSTVAGELLVRNGQLLAAGRDRVVRIGVADGDVDVLVGGLGAPLHGRPRLQSSGCRVIVESAHRLVAVDADPRRR